MLYWTKFFLSEVPKNLKSGITVALVNVPLSISLAIAGGAGLSFFRVKILST